MATIQHKSHDKTVATIAERNSINPRTPGMMVLVRDAIGDPYAGTGRAVYRWDEVQASWILMFKDNVDTLTFTGESKTISQDQIQLSFVPTNGQVWDVMVRDGLVVHQVEHSVAGSVVTIQPDTPGQFDGKQLSVRYAYGTMTQQLDLEIARVVGEAVDAFNKEAVGLGNVDNTADLDKPISTATKTALDGKSDTGHTHPDATTTASGLMSGSDKIKLDSVAENANNYSHPTSHPASIITQDANNRFVTDAEKAAWSGKQDVIAAGTTAQYWRGDKSWQALNKAAVGLGNVDNTSDLNKPISNATQAALDAKQATLVSGINIKTINGESLLGEGNIPLLAMRGVVGNAGSQDFGVGEYPDTLPSGFSTMVGTGNKASANYGNYQYTDGSVMVFVPKFYYRIGYYGSPRYATYGANAIDIAGIDVFADEAAANAAGYALHRAFKDGGAVKSGFFIDKYLASKNGTTSCKSVQNGVPISLTTNTGYTNSNGMTGCTGILADAVVLARARGAGVFNVASIFMYDALAKLSLAHGQAATGTANCAWYDATGTTNFPKGCNNNALADINDATVTFTTAGDTGSANKPKTGSASNLAKTTHNGQPCGVTDINGAVYQAVLGITQAGTSATDTTAITTGNAYVLKSSVALASLTGGFGGTTDAWGTTSSLTTNYDLINGFLPWTSATGWDYFGNGSNQVFSGATSGTDYLRSCSGIANTTGMSAAGTNQFGADGNYRYVRANLFPCASGSWSSGTITGVFCRYWSYNRAITTNGGFRCAAYGN